MTTGPSDNPSFQDELETLLNRHSVDNECNTPDFILAAMVANWIEAYRLAVGDRDRWFGAPTDRINEP